DHFVLFRYASRELPLSVLLASSLSAYWAGRVADVGGITPQHTLAMRRASTRLMHQVFPLSILLVLLAPLLYRLLYGPQFTEAAGVFSLYLLLVIPRCLLPQALLVGLRLNALLLRIALWELLLHLALSLLLVHTLGYAGAAWATLAAYSLEKILLVHHAQRRGVRLRQYLSIRTWLLYSLALVLSWGASWLFFS
ncbi:MAG: polysaccharide biosynthesis C-terminal domain-containing protein, partial [Sphingobacteriia bacterium]